ncbi:retrovirus-related Pol polyprotein from transposon opus [Trichonephila clavipes]|nr:retrovirus-related Pol polyprotein from transposon opus [Trichonephila clavipes]
MSSLRVLECGRANRASTPQVRGSKKRLSAIFIVALNCITNSLLSENAARELQNCDAMEFFENRNVLSLRQMSMTKLATTVCRDPKILHFMKINGCASFVFPSKNAHLYLEVKNARKDTWMWKSLVRDVNFTPVDHHLRRDEPDEPDWQIKRNVLPFARWEELVKKRISSLPKLLQHELLDVIRLVSIEIDKWIKHHSLIWPKSSDIARNFQYEFQWDSLGKIDREKTAMKLILNKRLRITDRYILCVLYGLMDMIPIQEKVPDEIIQTYRRRELPLSMAFVGIEINYLERKDMFLTAGCEQRMTFLGDVLLKECLKWVFFEFSTLEQMVAFHSGPCQQPGQASRGILPNGHVRWLRGSGQQPCPSPGASGSEPHWLEFPMAGFQWLLFFWGLFSDQPGLMHVLYHEIDTGDKGPVVSRPYRYDRVKQGIIDYHIDKMLRDGTICPINSPYASPVVLTRKKNDLPPDSPEAYRFAIDYRKLNVITKYPRYPLPVIDDLLTNIPHTGVMSTLDLRSGYFLLAISPKNIEKTAFITRNGTFAFLRMPFGFSRAAPNFQKAIEIILEPVIGRFVLVYMDDVIITSPYFKDHLDHLNQVFTLLRDAGLTLNKEKCHFARDKLKYLGLIIIKDGIETDSNKIKEITEMRPPKNNR